jgi:serine/threonine-protein kinase
MEPNFDSYKELQPGFTLNGGKYVIEKKIGEGGFGITYRAMQTGLNRAVCIKEYFLAGRCIRNTQAKTIQLQGADEALFEKYRAAFVKEAQTLAALHHPGIVEVIDIFDENNTSYMVMPFVEGRSLQSIVEKNGPLTYPEAVNYIGQIANAVGYIHNRHILHRDIKPDNIMITADYKAVLIDFGSAREFEEDKTQAQTSMVTHGYAPTEQYTRNSRKGAYTDIYAIGATLYFILTGKVPYEAAARITEAMPEPKELNPDLPEEANRTIMKAMQLKSQDRHQSIAEFMNDLRNINPSQPTAPTSQATPPAPTATQPAPTPVKSAEETKKDKPAGKKGGRPAVWVAIVAAIVVVAGAASYFAFFSKSPHYKEAEQAMIEYNKEVRNCQDLINDGNEANPQPLIDARRLLDSVIRPMDDLYSDVMPDVFKRATDIQDRLYPKLSEAAKKWSEYAYEQMKIGAYEEAFTAYEYSLSLWEEPRTREEYEEYKQAYSNNSTARITRVVNVGSSDHLAPQNIQQAPSVEVAPVEVAPVEVASAGDNLNPDNNNAESMSSNCPAFVNKFVSQGIDAYKRGNYSQALKCFSQASRYPALSRKDQDRIHIWAAKCTRAMARGKIRQEEFVAEEAVVQE